MVPVWFEDDAVRRAVGRDAAELRPSAPIVVLATLSAVPVVVVSVLTSAPVAAGLHGFSSQTLIVPPPVAVKAALAPVERTQAAREGDRRAGVAGQRDAVAVAVVAVGDGAGEALGAAGRARDRHQLADIVGDRAVVGDGRRAAADVEVGVGGVGDGRRGRRGERAGHVGERHAVARAVGAAEAGELQVGGEVRQARGRAAGRRERPAPAVAVIRVPAAPVNAPVPTTDKAAPLPLTMSRSVKSRAPLTDVSCIPAAPTALPAAPMTVAPPATWSSAPRRRGVEEHARAGDDDARPARVAGDDVVVERRDEDGARGARDLQPVAARRDGVVVDGQRGRPRRRRGDDDAIQPGTRHGVLADAHAQVLRVRRARLDGVAGRAREVQAPDLDAGAIAVGGVGDHGDRVAGRDDAWPRAGRHEGREARHRQPDAFAQQLLAGLQRDAAGRAASWRSGR